ncbi:MAG: HlyC/CorC family transporter [Saprospiraceae bacterium]|nr:HlyC/CorC family transporter [Saprospiraceae bacterium]
MVLIILILLFLVLSAFFSGSEIAFISANKLGIAVKKEQKTKTGQIISGFYEKPQSFLSTMLVGNNIALVAFTYFMTAFLMPIVEPGFGDGVLSLLIYTLITTVIILIAGEFFPKTYFNLHSTKMLFLFAYPLYFFRKLLAVPTYMMIGLSKFLLKQVLRVPVENAEDDLTRLDLENFIADSLSDDQDDIDKEILTNALNLGHLKVSDGMVPRTEIVSIDNEASTEELIEVFKDSKLSRIIVTDGDADNIEGYIHHQQLLHNPGTIKKMKMDILYVPEVMNLKDLMLQFIKDESSIACVVDEFGGTAGIITLEDILEEIFGEIEDEHDVEEYTMEKIDDNEYLFSGRLEVDFINEKFPELELPEGEYQTLSGYIVMTSETIPLLGEQVELGSNIFKIEEVDDTKIEIVRVIHNPEVDE